MNRWLRDFLDTYGAALGGVVFFALMYGLLTLMERLK